jgi:hypothetical protein
MGGLVHLERLRDVSRKVDKRETAGTANTFIFWLISNARWPEGSEGLWGEFDGQAGCDPDWLFRCRNMP